MGFALYPFGDYFIIVILYVESPDSRNETILLEPLKENKQKKHPETADSLLQSASLHFTKG